MVFCTGCGKALHESAPMCPQCGKPQRPVAAQAALETKTGPLWAAITSLVLGVVAALGNFDDAQWDTATVVGEVMVSGAGLLLGILSLNISRRGKGMAIAGVVTSAIGVLAVFGN